MNRAQLGRVMAAVVGLGIVAAACGVPKDDEPRTLSEAAVPFDLLAPNTTAPPVEPTGTVQVLVFFFKEGLLVEQTRDLANADPATVLQALFLGPSDGEELAGVLSLIPDGTLVTGPITNANGVLIVDISEHITAGGVGDSQKTAFAQIVFTLMSLPGVSGVQFRQNIAGVPTFITGLPDTGKPADQALTKDDYQSLAPVQ